MNVASPFLVKGIVILDNNGHRVCAKYFGPEFKEEGFEVQRRFEQELTKKTKDYSRARTYAEIILLKQYIVVFKFIQDARFYVIMSEDENPLLGSQVLQALVSAITKLLENRLDSPSLCEYLKFLVLAIDETIDNGMVLCMVADDIHDRVLMKGDSSTLPISEQSFSQAFQTAKDQIVKSFS